MCRLLTASALFLLLGAHASTCADAASSVIGQRQKPARSSRLDQYLSRASTADAAADAAAAAAAAAAPLRFGDVRALSKALEKYEQRRYRQQTPRWTNDDSQRAVSVSQALTQRNQPAVIGDGLFGPVRAGVRIQGGRRQLDYGLLPADSATDGSVEPRQGRSTSRYADRMDEIARAVSGSSLYAPEDDEDESDDYEEDDEEGEEDNGRSSAGSPQQQQQLQQGIRLNSYNQNPFNRFVDWRRLPVTPPKGKRPITGYMFNPFTRTTFRRPVASAFDLGR